MVRLTLSHDGFVPTPSPAQNLLMRVLAEVCKGLTMLTELVEVEASSPLPSAVEQFFEEYYVKHDRSGMLPADVKPLNSPLSTHEAELLGFLLTGTPRKEKPFILCGHAGTGKSTLAKYICWYLIRKEPSLDAAILPIYFSIFGHTENLKALTGPGIATYLDDELQRRAFPHIRQHFYANIELILKEADASTDRELQGVFDPHKIASATADPQGWLSDLKLATPHIASRLMLFSLLHYSRTVKAVVVVLDDADRLSVDLQRFALEYLSGLIARGALAVLAMRLSTLRAVIASRRDREYPESIPLVWSVASVKDILARRVQKSKELVVLQSQTHLEARLEAPVAKIASAFVDVLGRRESIDLFVSLSNQNLHSLFGKIQAISRSQYFRDDAVMRELLNTEAEHRASASPGAQHWFVLALLLGNHHGTFKSSDDAASLGLVNLFCTQDRNHRHYTYFVRLHLLARLLGSRREHESIRVKSIYNDYHSLFGDDPHFDVVFARALRRLITGALAFTTSYKPYKTEHGFWPDVCDDELLVAPAGVYYLETLILRLEYLWFMKDDVDWDEAPTPRASVREPQIKKGHGTLAALCMLQKLEYEMLASFAAPVPGRPFAKRYQAFFSAKRIPGSRFVLFTDLMKEHFCSYLKQRIDNYAVVYARELECLDELQETYASTLEAFAE